MNTAGIGRLRELAETIAVVSLSHLLPTTRAKLQTNALSVNAYPTEFGGLVHVGTAPHRAPVEHDLALISELAAQAGVEWLLFDAEAPTLDERPLYAPQLPEA